MSARKPAARAVLTQSLAPANVTVATASPSDAAAAAPAPAPPAPPASPAAETVAELATVEARVLSAFGDWKPGDVALLTETEVEQAAADGRVDPHPDAVAYAKAALAESED